MKRYSLLLSFILSANFLSAQEVTALGEVKGDIELISEVEYEEVKSVVNEEVEYEEVKPVRNEEVEYEDVNNKKVIKNKASKIKVKKKVNKEEVKTKKKAVEAKTKNKEKEEVQAPKEKITTGQIRKKGRARTRISGSITSKKKDIGRVEDKLKKAEDKLKAKKSKLSVKEKKESKLEISKLKGELEVENLQLNNLQKEFKRNL